MKLLGSVLIAFGGLVLLSKINMDTTETVAGQPGRTVGAGAFSTYIPGTPSQEVHSFARADERRTWLYIAGLAIIVGTILFGFGSVCERLDASLSPPATEDEALPTTRPPVAYPPARFDEWGNPLQQPPESNESAVAKFIGGE